MFKRQGSPAKVEAIDFDGPDSAEKRCQSCNRSLGRVAQTVFRPSGTQSMIRLGGKMSCPGCGVDNEHV